jgi:hypothetical protein
MWSRREVEEADRGRQLLKRLGYATAKGAVDTLNSGVLNCKVTREHIMRQEAIYGKPIASIKGRTTKKSSKQSQAVLGPLSVQVEQHMEVDIMFI